MNEITFELLKLVIMLAAALLTRYVIPWIRQKTDNEKFQTMIDWAQSAVLAAEQAYSARTGPEKKKIVTAFIKRILIAKNISLTDAELDILIESAVREMNAKSQHSIAPAQQNSETI